MEDDDTYFKLPQAVLIYSGYSVRKVQKRLDAMKNIKKKIELLNDTFLLL